MLDIILQAAFLTAVLTLLWYFLLGAPYVATNRVTLKKEIVIAQPKPGEKAADLGSGDGRVLIALAESGLEAHGYEVNPILVWLSRANIRKAGFEKKAFVHWGSFWGKDLSSFDLVTVYGIGVIMPKLERKLQTELKTGARVVSNGFTFPNWRPTKTDGGITVYYKN